MRPARVTGTFPATGAPAGAQFAQLNPTGEFVQTFFREKTPGKWYFWSSFDAWCFCLKPEESIGSADHCFLEVVPPAPTG